jgi:hypothetical protein
LSGDGNCNVTQHESPPRKLVRKSDRIGPDKKQKEWQNERHIRPASFKILTDSFIQAEKQNNLLGFVVHHMEAAGFPETWLPGYPFWLDDSPEMGLWDHPPTKALFRRLFENSVEVPSQVVKRLASAAQKAGVNVVMGINEREG